MAEAAGAAMATIAAAADGAEAAPLHRGLPDEISIWVIMVRLPPKSLLHCRAVCRAWRRATSARDFLLAHHGRQPSLPLLLGNRGQGSSLDVILFDHRAGLAAVDQLQPVTRLGKSFFYLKASYDGLLVYSGIYRDLDFSICNPATRQYARLPQLDGFALLGMYPHSPTGEYRLLLRKFDNGSTLDQQVSYVFTVGFVQPPRRVNCPPPKGESASVLFRGNLQWHVKQHEGAGNTIKVFNTTTESFRQMRAPAAPGKAKLFEMDGMLGMSSNDDAGTTIDIWMTQDYESEAWALKYRVELAAAELTMQFGAFYSQQSVVVPSRDGDVLVLLKFGDWLLQIDMDGKLVACFHRLLHSANLLKQTLVPHAFFPTLEGYVVNGSPFI